MFGGDSTCPSLSSNYIIYAQVRTYACNTHMIGVAVSFRLEFEAEGLAADEEPQSKLLLWHWRRMPA